MEDDFLLEFWILPVIIFIFIEAVVIFSRSTQKQKGKTASGQPVSKAVRMSKSPVQTKETVQQPEEQVMPPEQDEEGEASEEGKAIQETIQPKVRVSEHTHGTGGSLGGDSAEGADPCHEDQLPVQEVPCNAPEPAKEPAQPGMQFNWSGAEVARAFVMSEILTRPCDRKRR